MLRKLSPREALAVERHVEQRAALVEKTANLLTSSLPTMGKPELKGCHATQQTMVEVQAERARQMARAKRAELDKNQRSKLCIFRCVADAGGQPGAPKFTRPFKQVATTEKPGEEQADENGTKPHLADHAP